MRTPLPSRIGVPDALRPESLTAQTVPAPVPESEVFTPEQIGHALAAPTPQAGHTAPSAANAPAR